VKNKSEVKQQLAKDIIVRNYRPGDEDRIIKLLNMCYGEWGSLQKWRSLYAQYPTFKKEDVFIIEKDNQIIGHESLHSRDFKISRDSYLNTVTLSDAATHPSYRSKGLHNRLIEFMLQTAESRGAGLVFSWYIRGTGLHAHSKRIGFVEVEQPTAYMKVINPGKLLKSGLSDFLQKNPKLEFKVQGFSDNLHFRLGESQFSVRDLFGVPSKKPIETDKNVEIVFDESSIRLLAQFRTMNMRQRLQGIILLLLLRKAKIKFNSFRALFNLIRNVVETVGSI
jgi:predicted N-acetyltransferase YhbS